MIDTSVSVYNGEVEEEDDDIIIIDDYLPSTSQNKITIRQEDEMHSNDNNAMSCLSSDDSLSNHPKRKKTKKISPKTRNSSSSDSDDCIIIDHEEEKEKEKKILEITTGMSVFALKDKLKHIWCPAVLVEIKIKNELYCVKFNKIKKLNKNKQLINEYETKEEEEDEEEKEDLYQSKSTTTSIKNKKNCLLDKILEDDDDDEDLLVELDSTCIAYAQSGILNPDEAKIKIKSRVITNYKLNIIQTETNKNLLKISHMCSGTIAELPYTLNKKRYLIFFDNGYVSYANANDVYYIFDYMTMPIERLSFDHIYFLKSYFEIFPMRSMVNMNKKDMLTVYLNNKWHDCVKVEQVDCSLVKFDLKLKYLNHNLTKLNDSNEIQTNVWFYRGSPCILPIYDAIMNKITSYNDETVKLTLLEKYIMEKNDNELNDEKRNYSIKYNCYSSTQLPKTASKTTITSSITNSPPKKDLKTKEEPTYGKLVNIDLDTIIQYKTKDYEYHECNILCIFNLEDEISTKNDMNPLLIPIAHGWQRLFCYQNKTKYNCPKKYINYRAPCGKVLKSTKEIDDFLYLTDSKLTIDMYSFDFSIRINVNFKPDLNYIFIPDISQGEEFVPISCVNSIDNETWDTKFFTYAKKKQQRKQLKDVPLNTDPKNLEGCNCVDKCRDRSKCSCWRKTFEMTSFDLDEKEMNTNVGYRWGRLHQKVSTGIFECNSKCGCDERCSNRVVQNGTKVRLQLFKTLKKGWGVRSLDDIPKGTFITVYSGDIMNEQQSYIRSNDKCGDKYFADLNFIDCLDLKQKIAQRENLNISFLQTDNQASNTSILARKSYNSTNKTAEIEYIVIDSDEDEQERQTLSPFKSPSRYLNEQETKQLTSKEEKTQNTKSSIESNKFFKNLKESITEWDKPFIMDASIYGNISKFINHSCAPNLFSQNVFIDTYDFRFPWIAFFASTTIKAGTELCWDYGYIIDSIKDRSLKCYCNSSKCRGRLL